MGKPTKSEKYMDLRERLNKVWGDNEARAILLERMDELWMSMDPEERDQIDTRPVHYTPKPINPEDETW